MATILFLSICLYVFSSIKDVKKRKKYFIFSITLIVLIGFSRIYLNTHWVSDVLAGWCLGLFWATAPKAVNNFVIFKHKFLK
jgi:undecaprenyl-diphosphatase